MSFAKGTLSKLKLTTEPSTRGRTPELSIGESNSTATTVRLSLATNHRASFCKTSRRASSTLLNGVSFHSGLLLLLISLGVLLNQVVPSGAQADLSVSQTESPASEAAQLNPRECLAMFDTIAQARYVCTKPKLVPLLQNAESLAKRECEAKFATNVWNCSEFSLLKQPKLNQGSDLFREGAYVHALSFAAIAHSIAKACAGGVLNCTCSSKSGSNAEDENASVDSCSSDYLDYGIEVAETFLNLRYTTVGRDLTHEMIQYNFKAANLTIRSVAAAVPMSCKCHGVSGSCTVQTCHSQLPTFEAISNALKQKYDDACEVNANGHSDNAWIPECKGRDYVESDLIYRDTANWCVADSSIGAPGVAGRECDANTSGEGSCLKLCRGCDRRPVQHEETYTYKCDCSFYFCCEIHCNDCTGERVYYTCD